MSNIWQISSGAANRNYANVLLQYGVALIGSGDTGPWSAQQDQQFENDSIRRFVEEMRIGDVVLLRSGSSCVHAVGLVASEYQYLPQFDDVNGLDLQHARRVRWSALPEVYDFQAPIFGAASQQFSRVNHHVAMDYAQRFVNSPPDLWKTAPLPNLPEEQPPLEQIPGYLRSLVAQVQDLARLYQDPVQFGDLPAEDELIAHYLVPLLRALGWSVEQIGIKWRFVDVTVFEKLPRTHENVAFLFEAKRLGAGVEGALQQALGYLKTLGIERDVIVTDGIRYRLFSAESGYQSAAYANLARLKKPALELFDMISKNRT